MSWLYPGNGENEHPTESTPAAGARFIASKIDAIAANPDVWAKTVFILVYDENDGLFDHVPPPVPPPGIPDEFVTLKSPTGIDGGGFRLARVSEYPASSSHRGPPVAGCAANLSITRPTCGFWKNHWS